MSNTRKRRSWAPDPAVLAHLDQAAARDRMDASGPARRAILAAIASIPHAEATGPRMVQPVALLRRDEEVLLRTILLLAEQVDDLEAEVRGLRQAGSPGRTDGRSE